MMSESHPHNMNKSSARRKGQTLAEFAISLPILLLLLFGVLEFGRLFQSWVTIQNSARSAARYAITGAYNDQRYDIDTLVPCTEASYSLTLDNIVVPLYDSDTSDGTSPSYTVQTFRPTTADTGSIEYTESEYLYATWYGVEDCYPDDESLQQRRDILRLATVYDEARRGAAGLLLDESLTGNAGKEDLESFLYDSWANPNPGYGQRAWFNMVMCSARQRVYQTDLTEIFNNPEDQNSQSAATRNDATRRFWTADTGMDPRFPYGACVLKERPKETITVPNPPRIPSNYDIPWQDAGGAGERITILVTYNHPLITPLGLASYVTLQARRSAVNESFRVTNAERALGPSGVGAPSFASPTPIPDTETPTSTSTPSATPTHTMTPTSTVTPTPGPFSCTDLIVNRVTFNFNEVFVEVTNNNPQPTELLSSWLVWNPGKVQSSFPGAYIGFMALNEEVYWTGQIATSPVDSANDGNFLVNSYRVVNGGTVARWKAVVINGPQVLGNYQEQWDLTGSFFVFSNPNGANCTVNLTLPPPPPPTATQPGNFTASPTFTPDCASSTVRVEFVSFDPQGDVRLRVVNNRPVVSTLLGFTINWGSTQIRLLKVVAGGNNANDLPQFGGTGVIVWQNFSNGAYPPPVASNNGGQGQWVTNFSFPPNSSTFLHLDFTGVGASSLAAFGIHPSTFNGTNFTISCGVVTNNTTVPGGTGGPGGPGGPGNPPTPSSGTIFLSDVPTPVATVTRTNTPVPGPTRTFTPIPTPPPSPTPGPSRTPTATWTVSPTPRATSTPTITPEIIGGIGGGDG
jgi:hypothetical protein